MTQASLSRNAGEWAEFYVLLNVLSEGRLYAADGSLNKLTDNYFPVIKIEMQKSGQPKERPIPIEYIINASAQTITVSTAGNSCIIDMSTFREEADSFFQIISTRRGKGAFQVPEISNVLEMLNNPVTKQSSSKKADIHIVIHDIMTGFENEVGFSIKSQHSSAASLINASGQTLFQYKIKCKENYSVADIQASLAARVHDENGESLKVGPKERVSKLVTAGFDLEFEVVKSDFFRENLQLIDSSMDVFLADCLLVFMQNRISGLAEIVELVSTRNPCKFKASCPERQLDFYKYKMKRLIVDAALGMQPKAPWTGVYDASGGYIVVKSTGDVVCYHLYNWNALQDYLFNHLRFETPTSTGTGTKAAFNYGLYYSAENKHFMDICLQLRFK
ncbi:MAG: hypothetical protein ACI88H_000661 [Cocleimonas sp.]|jgi:hypothetical protein